MSEVTRLLEAANFGDRHAAAELLPLVYGELRKLAASKLAHEKPGQTLQATALVHEAYVRLVDGGKAEQWDSRGHFFAAAAEAMRRILVERARRKSRPKHGGDRKRIDLDDEAAARKEIKMSDAAHANIIRQLFGLDWENSLPYDIVLNTGRVPLDCCVDIVKQLLHVFDVGTGERL